MIGEACNACGALCDEDDFNRDGLGYCPDCYADSRPATAVERMRATKAGTFARQARECWADSTQQQRRQMVDLIRHAWRNHTAGRRILRGR